jgi:hypothetical protein
MGDVRVFLQPIPDRRREIYTGRIKPAQSIEENLYPL